ncbi:O-fucosyltransferase family protein [Raphanus sativus]|uniref:O-fucosyltransferase family protein n=1 Tax=Raphanus sativus TaxID=3726 RepID=A0A6J0LI39_RAPSA|nr:O-fucosyltransferase 9 isoform X2 [Raphanus sativus]KAJ4917259.1 O-fucosyltransferase family protein [Raphanus sativus]
MHGLSRLGNGNARSLASPPSSPRIRPSRGKTSNQGIGERLVFLLFSVVFRRKGVLLLAPLLYIAGMLLFMGSFGFTILDLGHGVEIVYRRGPPGSVYRSPKVFKRLWPMMEADANRSSRNALMEAWKPRVKGLWKPCISTNVSAAGSNSNGFFIIEANGGLNQQRLSICDAVAVAGLLNATLVIPIFHLNSVWRDSSKFGDIFDEDFFIYALSKNVKVVKELPKDILERYNYNISSIVNLRLKAWSSPAYYLHKVLPQLLRLGAVRVAPFSNRLAHAVPAHIQGLRCLANFEALRFADPIRLLAEQMVNRMVTKSVQSSGNYVSVHLRFEMDMVAFSCCEYDFGEVEKLEMDMARERGWKGKFRRRGRVIRPGANRVDGKCPLTPLEVGMMLRGMGFNNNTLVYVAAGNIYKADKYMAPLRQMFPLLQTKDTLATPEELAPFKGHSSRLAALDYTVCLHSEVFVSTQGGNFPHFLIGHRRYLYKGHAETIKPDKRKLVQLLDKPSIRWDYFKKQMQDMLRHNDAKGVELRKPAASLYTFPMPDCMCKEPDPEPETDTA